MHFQTHRFDKRPPPGKLDSNSHKEASTAAVEDGRSLAATMSSTMYAQPLPLVTVLSLSLSSLLVTGGRMGEDSSASIRVGKVDSRISNAVVLMLLILPLLLVLLLLLDVTCYSDGSSTFRSSSSSQQSIESAWQSTQRVVSLFHHC